MKKLIALMLALLMLLPLTVACKKEEPQGEETESADVAAPGEESESVTETETFINDIDTLPTDLDLGGKEVNVVTRSTTEYEFQSTAGAKGTLVERAVYAREASIEERFNTKINIIPMDADWGNLADFTQKVYAEYLNPTANWHVLSVHSTLLYRMVSSGYLQDLNNFTNIDMNKVWWSSLLYKDMNVDGHMYAAMGDINRTLYEYMQVMYYNETKFEEALASEGGKEMLYTLIEDGEWTWEKMTQFAAKYGSGDETKGGDGSYGFVLNAHAFRALFAAMDTKVDDKDEAGQIYYPETASERLINTVTNINTFLDQPNTQFPGGAGDSQTTQNKLFAEGKVLFYPQVLEAAKTVTSTMKDKFGVIPYPKYDEYQDQYKTICKSSVSAVGIMATVTSESDMLAAGTVTEALCMEGYKQVTPVYYQTVLQKQYLNDSRSSALLETIRNGLTVASVASLYADVDLFPASFQASVLADGSVDVVSIYTGRLSDAKKTIENFYTAMREMGLANF